MAAPPGWPYSPDGRFRWDGATWQPVQQPVQQPMQAAPPGAPAQPGLAVPPPPGPQAAQPYAVGRQAWTPAHGPAGPPGSAASVPGPPGPDAPRRRGMAVFALVTAGVLIAALGGVAGAAVGLAITEPVTDDRAPSFPGRFPSGKQRYLPKVTFNMVAVDWLQGADAWTCARSTAADPVTGARMNTICRPGDTSRLHMSVSIWHDGPYKVLSVKARCDLGVGSKPCTSLFAKMADTLLSPDRTLRAQAESWAKKNAAKAAVTSVGGVRLETALRPHTMEAVRAI